MQTFANIMAVIMLIVTVCSVVSMITPTPKLDTLVGKIYKDTIELGALNFWKAKDK